MNENVKDVALIVFKVRKAMELALCESKSTEQTKVAAVTFNQLRTVFKEIHSSLYRTTLSPTKAILQAILAEKTMSAASDLLGLHDDELLGSLIKESNNKEYVEYTNSIEQLVMQMKQQATASSEKKTGR